MGNGFQYKFWRQGMEKEHYQNQGMRADVFFI
jgi:hypothetical protein